MKVIMRKDVGGVGQRETLQEVADGYALNFLIPRGLAEQATTEKIAALNAHKASSAISQVDLERQQAQQAKQLQDTRVIVKMKVNQQGHLYRQLSAEDIARSIREQHGIDVAENSIVLKQQIKTTGEFDAEARLGERSARFRISVVSVKN